MDQNCTCKPKPGMIEDLITKYGIDQKSSIIIGDSYKDVEAGRMPLYREQYF